MEEKINVAELLKDCPKGMELDCTIFNTKVIYQGLNKRIPTHPIVIQTKHGFEFELTQYGQIHNVVGSECVIFPPGKITWEGFIPPCKFKVGDKVIKKGGIAIPVLITNVGKEFYYSNTENSIGVFSIKEQDEWVLVPDKFDITTLKPFDKVLVRDSVIGEWGIEFFGGYSEGFYYTTGNCMYAQCIPYEGNERLLRTTYNCDDFYKTWE